MINRIKMSNGEFVDRFEIKYDEKTQMIHQITLYKGDRVEEQFDENSKIHKDEWIKIQKELLELGEEEGFKDTPMYDLMLEMLEEVELI